MPQTPGKQKIVFLHVHKTGGITFRTLLQSLFADRFLEVQDARIEVLEPLLQTSDCIEFHNIGATPAHSELMQQRRLELLQDCVVFTMLRAPVDHAISLFHHIARTRPSTERNYRQNGGTFPKTLEEFAEDSRNFNTQTAFLAGKSQLGQPVDAADLAQAKQLLTELRTHVGLTERFSDSVHIFEQVTGLRIPGGTIVNRNRAPAAAARTVVSESIKEKIRRQSAFDLELYDFGRQLFLAESARFGPAPEYRYLEETGQPTAKPHAVPAVAPGIWSRLKALRLGVTRHVVNGTNPPRQPS